MDLITPAVGTIFWQSVVFILLLFILAKFAWKPILKMVNEREQSIADSLELAEKTKTEMKALQAQNEDLLKEARAERDNIIKEANEAGKKVLAEAKEGAKKEADKIIADAQKAIATEKNAAMADLKAHVATLSLEIAEKIVKGELASDDKQKALADKLADDVSLN